MYILLVDLAGQKTLGCTLAAEMCGHAGAILPVAIEAYFPSYAVIVALSIANFFRRASGKIFSKSQRTTMSPAS